MDKLQPDKEAWFSLFKETLQKMVMIEPEDTATCDASDADLDITPYAAVCDILEETPELWRIDDLPHPFPSEDPENAEKA